MSQGSATPDPWLRPGGVLVHIGPPKTGTTALQHALAEARPRLRRSGIRYPGKRTSHWHASCAVMGRAGTAHPADPPVPMRRWERLVAQVGAREDRAVVSSEGFADADADLIARIVADLGGKHVQVVLTVRSLAGIVPSSWQQDLKSGAPVPLPGALARLKSRVVKPYDDWVADLLADGAPLFWRRNDFAALADRWAQVVGAARLAVVVVRPDEPDQILRDAERLLGLAPRVLRRVGKSNRSLSREEAELVRRWLVALEREQLLPAQRYHAWVRRGGLWSLVEDRRPGADESRLVTPAWAHEQLQQRTRDIVARLRAPGYLVLGDLAALDLREPAEPDPPTPTWVPDDAAIAMLMGVLRAAGASPGEPGEASRSVQAKQLGATLRARLSRRR